MKSIQFTPREYKALLELVHIGEWVVNAHKTNTLDSYDLLSKNLFSKAKDFGLDDITIEEDPRYPNAVFEEHLKSTYIDEYDELTFWEELTERLTYREFKKRYTAEQIEAMDVATRFLILCKLEEEVNHHLQNYGYDQIILHKNEN